MKTFVVGRLVAPRCCRKTSLSIDLHARSEAIAVAARAMKCDGEPMSCVAAIHEDPQRASENRGYNVNRAVIVQVAESCTPSGHQICASGVGSLKTSVAIQG